MGNKDSRQQFQAGYMHIDIPQTSFQAGEMVQGVIHLYLEHKFPTKVLQLEIYGKEKTFWITKEKRGKHTYKKKHLGKNPIFSTRTILHAFPDGEAFPGQYSFPFVFQLPDWIPSSFIYYGQHSKSEASIRYSVVARMEECADSSKTTYKPFISKRRIIVRKPVMNVSMNKTISLKKDIKTFFFIKQGESKVDVVLERDAYKPNETIVVHCKFDNTNCDKDLKNVRIKLRRFMVATAADGKKFYDDVIISKKKFDGLSKGLSGDMKLELDLNQLYQDTREIRKTSRHRDLPLHPEDIALQQTQPPSVKSSLIDCNYFLEVSFDHRGFTVGSHIPKAVWVVNIQNLTVQQQFHHIDAPQNWNPQQFQPIQVGIVAQPSQVYQQNVQIGYPEQYPYQQQLGYGQQQQAFQQPPFQQPPVAYPYNEPPGLNNFQGQQYPNYNQQFQMEQQPANYSSPHQNNYGQPPQKGVEYEPYTKPGMGTNQVVNEQPVVFNPQDQQQ